MRESRETRYSRLLILLSEFAVLDLECEGVGHVPLDRLEGREMCDRNPSQMKIILKDV